MAYVTNEARQDLLDGIADAIDEIGAALGALGGAYELLDERTADRLEEELFRPVQRALGRAKRTQSGFARRFGLDAPALASASPGLASQGVKAFVTKALTSASEADRRLSELQDSMLPIEAGDPELRAGLAEIREQLARVPGASESFLRTFGR